MIKIEINKKAGKNFSDNFIREVLEAALDKIEKKNAEVSVAFVGEQEIKKWNKLYRGKNKATDVLSFVYKNNPLVGEIIVCYPEAVRQAREGGRTIKDEIKFLLVHGALHLCGFDHEKGEREAKKMRRMEQMALEKLQYL